MKFFTFRIPPYRGEFTNSLSREEFKNQYRVKDKTTK
jgi:hypothetical protein